MKSATPKVLHPLLGRTLLGHVLAAADAAPGRRAPSWSSGTRPTRSRRTSPRSPRPPRRCCRPQQNGTGHAVRIALDAIPEAAGTVVVLNGDVPLLRPETVEALVARARVRPAPAATVLAAEVADPTGLGRIVRDAAGNLERIVEERDASAEVRAIREINAGIYAFDAALLREALGKLSTDNDQGEEYLTDVFGLLAAVGHPVGVFVAPDADGDAGLQRPGRAGRAAGAAAGSGEHGVDAGRGVDPRSGDDLDRRDRDARAGRGDRSELAAAGCDVGGGRRGGRAGHHADRHGGGGGRDGAADACDRGRDRAGGDRGPVLVSCGRGRGWAARRRSAASWRRRTPSWARGRRCRICRMWVMRRSGAKANIGAGTIFANYDGVNKHHTTVGEAAFVGSDTVLIAPVEIGPGAYVAAGSAVGEGRAGRQSGGDPGAAAQRRGLDARGGGRARCRRSAAERRRAVPRPE